jgi:hypothetical protein
MKSSLAFPFNDQDGALFHHLQVILADLKSHFERAYICPPLSTLNHVEHMQELNADDFFTIIPIDRERQIGEYFHFLYQRAAEAAPPEQIIHLCYLDRVAFALQGEYREAFLTDIDSLSTADVPSSSSARSLPGPRIHRITAVSKGSLRSLGTISSAVSWIMPGATSLRLPGDCVRSCLRSGILT